MKRRFITCLMFAAIIGAGMTTVTSCADYDSELRDLQSQIDNHTKLIDALQIQANSFDAAIKKLQEDLSKVKSCECSDEKTMQIINNYIEDYVNNSGKFQNFDEMMDAILDLLSQEPPTPQEPGLTEEQVEELIHNCLVIKNMKESIEILQKALEDYYTKDEVDTKLLILNNAISEVEARVDGIDLQIIDINSKLTEVKTTADAALQQAKENLEAIKLLKQSFLKLNLRVLDLDLRISELEKTLEECYYTKTQVDDLLAKTLAEAKVYTDTEIGKLQKQIDDIVDDITELQEDVKALQDKVAENTKDIKSLFFNQNHLITSIELQGSKNPAFGRYALPDGTSSNVLIAYYGYTEHPVNFPAYDGDDLAAVCASSNNWITAADYAVLSTQPEEYNGALVGEEGNAGKLYLTVNPSSVDFTGTNFKLVNSLGEESPITLGDLKPCTEKLTFGYSRATATPNPVNGFYEASATLNEANIDAAKFVIDEQLKDAVKDVYKNKQDANFSKLAAAIYNQFNGFLDAYGVQGEYQYEAPKTDADGNRVLDADNNPVTETKTAKVTSRYDIAATAFKPLSYAANFGKLGKLPTITPLSERDIDLNDYIKIPTFDFSFSGIDEEKFKDDMKVEVHFSDVWVETDGSIWTNVHMTEYITSDGEIATAPEKMIEEKFCLVDADGTFNGPIYEDGTNPTYAVLSDAQKKAINAMIALIVEDRAQVWSAQLQDGFQDLFTKKLGSLVSDINGVVANIAVEAKGKLESAINDMIADLNDALNSKLSSTDRFVKQLNKLSNRVNNKLDNLSNLLQATIVYEGADGGFHRMSTAKGMPSVVEGTGAIKLYATSLTGEIAAPAFKKFVAVTNIYKDGKNAHEDATLKAALQSTNNADAYMDVVFEGDRNAVVFTPSVSGATYEIVYSALDYNGKISQRKFYVYVK